MATCSKALVGNGTAQATANGVFNVNGCVLLFNGQPQGGKPTLQVFTRVQASNPSKITCANPSSNTQGNATILLTGVLKPASGLYGKVLDVDHITQAATFPLTIFKTTIKKGNYISARCAATNKTWNMKTTWTYNNNASRSAWRRPRSARSANDDLVPGSLRANAERGAALGPPLLQVVVGGDFVAAAAGAVRRRSRRRLTWVATLSPPQQFC